MNRLLNEYNIYVSNNTRHNCKRKRNGLQYRSFYKFGELPQISDHFPFILIFKKKPPFMIKSGKELVLYHDTLKEMNNNVRKKTNPPCLNRNYTNIETFLKRIREKVRTRGFCFAKIEELNPILIGWGHEILFHSKYCIKQLTKYTTSPKHIHGIRKKYIGSQQDIDIIIDINCHDIFHKFFWCDSFVKTSNSFPFVLRIF